MVKVINLANLGEIESQRQIDELTKQQIVGRSILDFETLNVGSGRIKEDFKAEMIHQSIETLVIYIHQLQDEPEEEVKNEEEIQTFLVKTIKNNLRVLERLVDSRLQPLDLLFDAYLKGNHSPEILATAFIMGSLENAADMHKHPVDFTIECLIAYYQNHASDFVKALKHAWNPLLDEKLKDALNGINDAALARDLQTILDFRKESRKTNEPKLIHLKFNKP